MEIGWANVYPQAEEQRCWNNRIVNLLAKLPRRVHKPALLILRQIPYAQTRREAQRLKEVFQDWCRQRGLTLAAELIEQTSASSDTSARASSIRTIRALERFQARPGCQVAAIGSSEAVPEIGAGRSAGVAHRRVQSR